MLGSSLLLSFVLTAQALNIKIARTGFHASKKVNLSSQKNAMNEVDKLSAIFETRSMERRKFLEKLSVSSFLSATISTELTSWNSRANAYYESSFPQNLDSDSNLDKTLLKKEWISERKKEQKDRLNDVAKDSDFFSYGSFVWGLALWLLTGSRSNPLVTPLANALYDENNEEWLKDRNEGLFAPVPIDLLFISGVAFVVFGLGTDFLIRVLADGNPNISLQLAGVSLIGGAALELGRVASGEKRLSREQLDRELKLQKEFAAFAEKRLKLGGNCHRSEVVKAFRRFYAQYRNPDDNILSDLEIERVFRLWSQKLGIDMSSAGFFSGIQINEDADVFANR